MHIENKDIEWLEEKDGKAYLKKVEIAEYTRKYTSKQKPLLEIEDYFIKINGSTHQEALTILTLFNNMALK